MSYAKKRILKLLSSAGVEENGGRPWDIQVHDQRLYRRILIQGTVGLGEAYMDGWWDCAALDDFFARCLQRHLDQQVPGLDTLRIAFLSRFQNMQNRIRSRVVARRHYDVGNDLYEVMLDQRMLYSCAYWRTANTLDEAQKAKLDLIACKLDLQPGSRVLDIGCGWGGACEYFAREYKVSVVGVTLSERQCELARQRCADLSVEVRLMDYRDIPETEQFDAIYSIGMFEHVGYKNYAAFMKKAHALLPVRGRVLLHTIGGNTTQTHADPWINRYIFPHGMMPSVQQIGRAIESLFVMEDWHNFGPDYDRTLMEWRKNFELAWGSLSANYDERFFRMWRYYLSCSAGSFRVRANQLWQVLLVREGLTEVAPSCR